MRFHDDLNTMFHGMLQWGWTAAAVTQAPTLEKILQRVQPKRVLEIGTHQGLSTAFIAGYVERVITLDIVGNDMRDRVWQSAAVKHKIQDHVIKSQLERDSFILKTAPRVDMVFIDGNHLMDDVKKDYELSRGCKNLLFHDYWDSEDWPDVKAFIDALKPLQNVTIYKPFALVQQ